LLSAKCCTSATAGTAEPSLAVSIPHK
jgi:hypothetical protein